MLVDDKDTSLRVKGVLKKENTFLMWLDAFFVYVEELKNKKEKNEELTAMKVKIVSKLQRDQSTPIITHGGDTPIINGEAREREEKKAREGYLNMVQEGKGLSQKESIKGKREE